MLIQYLSHSATSNANPGFQSLSYQLMLIGRRVGSVGWVLDFESKGSGFDPYKVYPGIFQKVVNYELYIAVVAYNILVSPSGFGKVAKAWCALTSVGWGR